MCSSYHGPSRSPTGRPAAESAALDTASHFLFVHSPALTVALVPDPSGRPGVVAIRYAGSDVFAEEAQCGAKMLSGLGIAGSSDLSMGDGRAASGVLIID